MPAATAIGSLSGVCESSVLSSATSSAPNSGFLKRVLRGYDCPPRKQVKATRTMLELAEVLCDGWMS